MKVNVLGTEYSIKTSTPSEDRHLEECDGYCDETTKQIVLASRPPEKMDKGDLEHYAKKCIRHELVHAFLYESGLHENCEWANNEEVVDWIAAQGKKIYAAWQEADAI